MTNRQVCPVCAESVFTFRGPEKSPYLIIAEEPTTDDRVKMTALSGGPGWILRNELDRAGLDMFSHRIGYMFWHEMKAQKESDACRTASIEYVLKEAQGRKAILLLGAATVKYFVGISVDIVSSLRVRSQYLKCQNVLAGVSPNSALSGTVGEIRLVCQRWSEMLEEIEEKQRIIDNEPGL